MQHCFFFLFRNFRVPWTVDRFAFDQFVSSTLVGVRMASPTRPTICSGRRQPIRFDLAMDQILLRQVFSLPNPSRGSHVDDSVVRRGGVRRSCAESIAKLFMLIRPDSRVRAVVACTAYHCGQIAIAALPYMIDLSYPLPNLAWAVGVKI